MVFSIILLDLFFISARRWLYGEKTVRKAERAWFLSEGEESEALIRVAFDSLGQKQRVFEPYSLSLSLKWRDKGANMKFLKLL